MGETDRWIEVLDADGNVNFINPAHIVTIQLIGAKQGKEARIFTMAGDRSGGVIRTPDAESVERVSREAFRHSGFSEPDRSRATPGYLFNDEDGE